MSDVSIEIHLNDGEPVLDMRRYRPGDTISGQVIIYANQVLNPRKVTASLEWQTAGRGTTYNEKIEEYTLLNGDPLTTGFPNTYPITFTLPEKPWSYEGHYIKIFWKIAVNIDLAWKKDPRQEQMILVEPDRSDAWNQKGDGFSSF
mgnify:CR=1 FL=1